MLISLIVAVARNGVIGRDGDLAWKISDDLKRFRALTIGKPVVMGRKTFESICKPLPERANIVVSRSMGEIEGVVVARTIANGLRAASDAAARLGVNEIVIIGGAEIYASTLPLAGRIYLTEVDADVDGDVCFPVFDPAEWTRHPDGGAEKSARNEFACEFFILDRI
jgi:dihydrofolate reductase